MKITEFESRTVQEKIICCEYDNGLNAFVLPKKNFSKRYATYATRYGSIDSEFIFLGEQKSTKVPDGIAHFLEHMLFEQEDGSVMDKFSALGASSNAYTSFDHTAYMFSCSENFNDCFNLLVRFVQNPYLTNERIEKENSIINNEIMMRRDNPDFIVFFNYINALYHRHPVRIDIAGTIESIDAINKETLYNCYNTFYNPSNMMIFVTGDVDTDWVFDTIRNNQNRKSKPEIKRIFPEEPEGVHQETVEQRMEIASPLFLLGFKENISAIGKDITFHTAAMKILMKIIFGKSSDIFSTLYEKGLITSNLGNDYEFLENCGYSYVAGESKSPYEVRERVIEAVKNLRLKGLKRENFERIKKMAFGSMIKGFNSTDGITDAFVENNMKGINLFKLVDAYREVDFETIVETFESHFVLDKMAMSVINPLENR